MTLDILIPQYNEDDILVKRLLDSIAIQQHVDFNNIKIIICNDGSNTLLSQSMLESFPFKVEYHLEPHNGVSATRNACLRYSKADYIMYCDADDMFYHFDALHIIFTYMARGFDLLLSSFMYESIDPETGDVSYIRQEPSNIFVHGKVYNRQFLTNQNILWNDKLTIHEDCYFNKLCEILSNNTVIHQTPYYIWKHNPASVSRNNYLFPFLSNTNMIDSFEALVDELIKRGRDSASIQVVINVIYEIVYSANALDVSDPIQKDIYNKCLKRFRQFYLKFKTIWVTAPDLLKARIQYGTRLHTTDMLDTIDAWLQKVEDEKLYVE